jgi:hypothetical protein
LLKLTLYEKEEYLNSSQDKGGWGGGGGGAESAIFFHKEREREREMLKLTLQKMGRYERSSSEKEHSKI